MTTENAKTPPTPPSPPLPPGGEATVDSRIESFMQKAQPIIAKERGINPRSRILLESIAQDMRLPAELFDQAIHMLQGAPPVAKKKAKDHWVKAFEKYLERKIKDVPQGIVTATIESRCIQRGIKKFDLSEDQARDTVREMAAELGLRRISLSEAERHVGGMIAQKVGDAAWLDDGTMKRLQAAGVGWGLTTDQVDALIRQHTQQNRDRQDREQRINMIMLTGAGVVVLVMICVFVGVMLLRNNSVEPKPETVNKEKTNGDPTTNNEPKPIVPVENPKWWNDKMSSTVTRIRVNLLAFEEIYQQIAAADDAARTAGYEQLIGLCKKNWAGVNKQPSLPVLIGDLLSACYVGEPDDKIADNLRGQILAVAELESDEVPTSENFYSRAFWAVRCMCDALTQEGLSDARADALEMALGRIVGTAANRRSDVAQLTKRCLSSLARKYYAHLTANVSKNKHIVGNRHEELSEVAKVVLDANDHNRLDSEYLAAMLLHAPDTLPTYGRLLAVVIQSQDPLNALKMIELMEKTTDQQLQLTIAALLVRRFELNPVEFGEVGEIATHVRKFLGVKAPVAVATAADRWKLLKSKTEEALNRLRAPALKHDELLKRTVDVAHLATLACAVAQQEPGFPVFDQLLESGTPGSKRKTESTSSVGDDEGPFRTPDEFRSETPRVKLASTTDQKRLDTYVERLSKYDQLEGWEQRRDLRGLTELAGKMPRINPVEGMVIARYLLGPKDDAEQEKILEFVRPLSQWHMLKLGLADQMVTTERTRAEVERFLKAFLGRDVALDESRWRQFAYDLLLRDVLDQLAAPKTAFSDDDPNDVYDSAAASLHEFYKKRAQLLGVGAEGTESASQVLRLLIDHEVARFSGSAGKNADGQFLTQLPHQLRAIDYLGTNDLRRMVLLQRIRIRLLAIDIKRRQPDQERTATRLVDDLVETDVAARDVINQLADGETVLLKLWMLSAPE